MEGLAAQLAQLSAADVRALLAASGHADVAAEGAGGSAAPRSTGDDSGDALLSAEERALEAQRVKDEGNASFRQGRFEDAACAYSRCVALDPTSALYLSNRAAALLKLERYEDAIADCSSAIRLAPSIKVKGNPSPGALNGHTLFRGPDDRVYLFGGRSVRDSKAGLFVRDDRDGSWDVVHAQGRAPHPRAWHSVALIDASRGVLCVYGGVSSLGEDPRVYLLVPDVSSGSKGAPTPRVEQWTWVDASASADHDYERAPDARSGHAAVSIASRDGSSTSVLIFGGRTKRGVSNALYELALTSAASTAAATDGAQVRWRLVDAGLGGNVPAARDGHSMCVVHASAAAPPRLLVFGGNGQQNGDKMNDTWMFDVQAGAWEVLECSGDIPSPRSYHSAHVVGPYMFVVGGRTIDAEDGSVYVLDTGAREWFRVPIPRERQLSPRAWHASVLTSAGSILLTGGGTFHGPLRDAATLDLSYLVAQCSAESLAPATR